MKKVYWIKCDIDGRGEKWRLAVETEGDEYGTMYTFPTDDFFEDYRETYEEHEKVLVKRP